jgi:hypothetical protein
LREGHRMRRGYYVVWLRFVILLGRWHVSIVVGRRLNGAEGLRKDSGEDGAVLCFIYLYDPTTVGGEMTQPI